MNNGKLNDAHLAIMVLSFMDFIVNPLVFTPPLNDHIRTSTFLSYLLVNLLVQ